ncbi:class II histone deacetylase [Quadrisphaera setariae]|uniref:Class II histone deacetylase n=1 Tax=Quadrisphaera setariae TaxID=2593304 RepID=A0A5C8ZJG6_9ACTN|nr:class II histone deacetylase [Quadrisphaera setariae]TXR58032.1 class II histone deacetylase [Quadrisphaera setariae]
MRTGYVWEELYGWHDTGTHAAFVAPGGLVQPHRHVESAESKTRFAALVEVSGLGAKLDRIRAVPAAEDDVLAVHTAEHLERIRAGSAAPRGGDAGDGTSPFGPGGLEIALLAAGGAVQAASAVVTGRVTNAYALVRPPGHHARPETGMGFCVFANAAIAIQHVRRHHGVERVAVVDWDVHHGNGTEEVFAEDPDVLTISVHQDQLYPKGTGRLTDRGRGAGEGSAINVPLPAGTGNDGYLHAVEQVVLPALERHRPDLVVVASGFDPAALDPLGGMVVTTTGFRRMARAVLDAADRLCDGRVVMTHEGGYSPVYAPLCGVAVLEEMSGERTEVTDFLAEEYEDLPDQALRPHQAEAVAAAAAAAGLQRAGAAL